MRISKLRYYAAGLVAFLIGMPLTEKAFAQTAGDIVAASLSLADAIGASAGAS